MGPDQIHPKSSKNAQRSSPYPCQYSLESQLTKEKFLIRGNSRTLVLFSKKDIKPCARTINQYLWLLLPKVISKKLERILRDE